MELSRVILQAPNTHISVQYFSILASAKSKQVAYIPQPTTHKIKNT